ALRRRRGPGSEPRSELIEDCHASLGRVESIESLRDRSEGERSYPSTAKGTVRGWLMRVSVARLRRERDLDSPERPQIHPHAVPGLHPDRRRERPADDVVAGAEPLAEGGEPVDDVAHHRGEIAGRGRRVHAGDLVTVAERPGG